MVKTSINLLLVFFLFGFSAAAQQVVNDPNAEVRAASGFHAVSVSSGIDLYLTPGNEEAVVISADDKVRSRIIVEVKNGTLKIYYDWKNNIRISWSNNKKPMKAYVSFKQLKSVSASGGSDVSVVNGELNADNLDISCSGGSDFTGSVSATNLTVDLSGGSDADLRGKATKMDANISGGSDIDAYGLSLEHCTINASGGSDATLNVSVKLVANASGGSDIDVKGKCEITKSASGASEIRRRD